MGFCVLNIAIFFRREHVVSIDKVVASFDEIVTSFGKDKKCIVHKCVMNLFCRLLFRESHPKYSRKHYFFSTVGVCCCYIILSLEKKHFCNYLCFNIVFIFL